MLGYFEPINDLLDPTGSLSTAISPCAINEMNREVNPKMTARRERERKLYMDQHQLRGISQESFVSLSVKVQP